MKARLALLTSDLTPRACVMIASVKAYRMNSDEHGVARQAAQLLQTEPEYVGRRGPWLGLLAGQARDAQADEDRDEGGQGEGVDPAGRRPPGPW